MSFWPIFTALVIASGLAIMLGYATVGYYMLALLFVGLLLFYRVQILKFVREVRVELEKCSWPWDPNQTGFKKYKELLESTIVVVISVILLAGYVTSWDFLLAHVVGYVTGSGLTTITSPTVHTL
jgi:preprotein translocase subunit SecE